MRALYSSGNIVIDPYKFIDEYTTSELDRISFSWNGKSGGELEDNNYGFRSEVIKTILANKSSPSSELIRDLLLAEAYFSKEAWGATEALGPLGVLLLNQSREKHIDSFFEAKEQSFDTESALTCYEVSADAITDIISSLESRLPNSRPEENIEYYLGYFSDYLPKETITKTQNESPWWKLWK